MVRVGHDLTLSNPSSARRRRKPRGQHRRATRLASPDALRTPALVAIDGLADVPGRRARGGGPTAGTRSGPGTTCWPSSGRGNSRSSRAGRLMAALAPVTTRGPPRADGRGQHVPEPGPDHQARDHARSRVGRPRRPRHRRRLVRARARGVRHRLRSEPRRAAGLAGRSVALMRRLLDGERFSHEGEPTRSTTPSPRPRPIQARLPILIGGSGRRKTLRTVAQRADGWNISGTLEEVRGRADRAPRATAADVGRDLATLEMTISFPIVIDDDAAVAQRADGRADGRERRHVDGRRAAPRRVAGRGRRRASGPIATSASRPSSCGCPRRTTPRRSSGSARSPPASRTRRGDQAKVR